MVTSEWRKKNELLKETRASTEMSQSWIWMRVVLFHLIEAILL